MKLSSLGAVMALAVLFLLVSAVADEKPWFDMEKCSFCKHLTKDPQLMENLSWEYHDISNGVLNLTTVKPEFKDSYLKAVKAMEKVGEEMQSGKTDIYTCGHCDNYGKLMMSGANFEVVEADAGWVVLITSDKPEVVKTIQEFGQRTSDELAKMAEKE